MSELPTPKSDKPRGLRRLGTVLSRRRESKIPAGAGRIAESAESTPDKRASRLPTSASFASFGRSARSRENMLDAPREEEDDKPRSPLRTMSGMDDGSEPALPAAPINGLSRASTGANGHDDETVGKDMSESSIKPAELSAQMNQSTGSQSAGSAQPQTAASAIDASLQADREAEEQAPQAIKVDIRDPAAGDAANDDVLATMANALKMVGVLR